MRIIAVGLLVVTGGVFGAACNCVGSTSCTGLSNTLTNGTCTLQLDHCDDAHVYEEACSNGKCTCNIDGKLAPVASKATTCPSSPTQLNADCSWSLSEFQQS